MEALDMIIVKCKLYDSSNDLTDNEKTEIKLIL